MSDRLPLHDLHVAAGATLELIDGRERPLGYGDPAAEYAAVRRAVGVIDRGDLGVLEVTGRDRASFLHAMLSNDVKSLGPGGGRRAALLDVHGKVQVLLLVLAFEERLLVLTPPGMAAPTFEILDRYLFSEKAYFKDVSADVAALTLAGPEAPSLAARLAGAAVSEGAWSHAAGTIDGAAVTVVRGDGETGEAEVWLIGAAGDGGRWWRAVMAAGARPVGRAAEESLRLEAGTPRYGRDVDGTVLLPEIPLADLVSYSKGCYIGQEVVVRIRDRGHVNRHLRGLIVDGAVVPAAGARVSHGDAEVGRVTSATWSFGLGRPIALAFVRRQQAEPGTRVRVDAGDEGVEATISALPFAR